MRFLRVCLRGLVVIVALIVDIVVWDGAVTTRSNAAFPLWLAPVAMAVTSIPLFWRYRAPLLTAVPSWLMSLVAVLLVPQWQPFAVLMIAVHAVASIRPARVSVPSTLVCLIPLGLQAGASADRSPTGPWIAAFAVFALFQVLLVGAAFGFGRWSYLSNQRTLEQTAVALRAERLKLARDLHDTIASNLTAMMVHASGAGQRLGSGQPEVARALNTIGIAGNRAMDEMARLLGVLRTVDSSMERSDGAPSDEMGLAHVPSLLEEFARERGLDVVASTDGDMRALDAAPDGALFRVIKEGLSNAAKYGDRAEPCRLRVTYGSASVTVEVENCCTSDETAPPLPAPRLSFGWGLTGLRETIELVGGRLQAGRVSNRFTLRATVPTRPTTRSNGKFPEKDDARV